MKYECNPETLIDLLELILKWQRTQFSFLLIIKQISACMYVCTYIYNLTECLFIKLKMKLKKDANKNL